MGVKSGRLALTPQPGFEVGTALYLLSCVKIRRDYLFSMDLCPVIGKVTSLATRVDSKVFYYYKATTFFILLGLVNLQVPIK